MLKLSVSHYTSSLVSYYCFKSKAAPDYVPLIVFSKIFDVPYSVFHLGVHTHFKMCVYQVDFNKFTLKEISSRLAFTENLV